MHDPGWIVCDLVVALALGGDCLADIAVLRAQPELAGPVASDPVVSRLIATLASDRPRAIRAARTAARERAWALAGDGAPGGDGALITIDIDATIVTAHSEKENAAPTWKKTFGFHPLAAFADHGAAGSGKRWPSCCGRGTPGPTPRPSTSRRQGWRSRNCRGGCRSWLHVARCGPVAALAAGLADVRGGDIGLVAELEDGGLPLRLERGASVPLPGSLGQVAA